MNNGNLAETVNSLTVLIIIVVCMASLILVSLYSIERKMMALKAHILMLAADVHLLQQIGTSQRDQANDPKGPTIPPFAPKADKVQLIGGAGPEDKSFI